MKSRLAIYFTSIIVLAMAMILSPGFDVWADTYDSETEIELTGSTSPTSPQENLEQFKAIENIMNDEDTLVMRNPEGRRFMGFNIIPTNRQKIFCIYRE